MIYQCFGCPTQPVSKLGWFKSPCICTVTQPPAEEPEPAVEEAQEEPEGGT
jgi:hypothetical protein